MSSTDSRSLIDQQIVDRGDGHQQALELKVGDVHWLAPWLWRLCCDACRTVPQSIAGDCPELKFFHSFEK